MEVAIEFNCPICGEDQELMVELRDWKKFIKGTEEGMDIEDIIMPYFTPTEVAQFLSHVCPDCQKKIFPTAKLEEF